MKVIPPVRIPRALSALVPALMMTCLPASAFSQGDAGYPSKLIRLIVGQAPGGATDIVARMIAQKLSEQVRQSVIVENRTGAAGSIGASFVVKSAPDGYTLLVVSSSYAINPSLYSNLPFDPVKDLAPVSLIAEAPFLLVIHPSLPARSVKELVALAKSKPGALNFASGGNGSSGHLAGELFEHLAGIQLVHVPYKGAGPALVEVMTGQVHMTFGSVLSSLQHVKNQRLRALAVTGAKRSSALPALPTVAEAGIKGYRRTTWYGVLAPAATSPALVTRISDEFRKAVNSDDVRKRILTDGAEPEGSSPKEFREYLASEMKIAQDIVQKAGLKPQ